MKNLGRRDSSAGEQYTTYIRDVSEPDKQCCYMIPLTDFDVVAVTNLTRVVDPTLLLRKIHERIRPGGVLLVFSDYGWDAKVTPYGNWVGGKKVWTDTS